MKLFSLFVLLFPIVPGLGQGFGCFNVNEQLTLSPLRTPMQFGAFNSLPVPPDSAQCGNHNGWFTSYSLSEFNCENELIMEGNMINGKPVGMWKFYRGDFQITGLYNFGKREGKWTGYLIKDLADTIVFFEQMYSMNLPHGTSKRYERNGQLIKKENYWFGRKHGSSTEYIPGTKSRPGIQSFSEYRNDTLHGKFFEAEYLNPDDTSKFGYYINGNREGQFLIKTRTGRMLVHYEKGRFSGLLTQYHHNGKPFYQITFRNNLPWEAHFANDNCGDSLDPGDLRNGSGILNMYYADGSLKSSVHYNKQFIIGKMERYYETGELFEQGVMVTDTPSYDKSRSLYYAGDVNLFAGWQMNFLPGSEFRSFNKDGSVSTRSSVSYDSINGRHLLITRRNTDEGQSCVEKSWRGLMVSREGKCNAYLPEMEETYLICETDSGPVSFRHGTTKYFYPDGTVFSVLNFESGKERGKSFYYDENGNLKRVKVTETNGEIYNIWEGDTVNRIDSEGKKQGKWITFPLSFSLDQCVEDPDGIQYFKDDKPVGSWESYWTSNNRLREKKNWSGPASAYVTRFSYDGSVIYEGNEIHGNPDGEWKYYHPKKHYLSQVIYFKCGSIIESIKYNRKGKVIRKE